jgi:phage terminase large subunit
VAEVIVPYTPRAAFETYHATESRYCLTVAHRRAGKTVARINKLIQHAAGCTKQAPRFGYLAPYYIQAKDIAWAYLKHYTAPIIQATGGKINESELSVQFGHNGAVIRLYGAENAERLRGLYFDGIAADEAQDIAPSALTQVIMPALSDRQGWLDLSGTPKGWGNLLGETYKRALDDPEWFVQVLKASQTKLIAQEELDRLKRAMPENEYLQEFECSFDAAITGAYYAMELTKAEEEGRITNVPYDPMCRTYTAWDLGISDSMSIWFIQSAGRELRVIDYYEAAGHGLDHYAGVLTAKGYNYSKHYGPHDIQVRELGSGRSRWEIAKNLGITFDVVKMMPVQDGMNAVRMTLPRMWFDAKKTAIGIDALRQYREKVDEKRGIALGPLHDWTSHAADAMRYFCVGHQEETPTRPLKIERRFVV